MIETIHTIESLSQNPDEIQTTIDQLAEFRRQLYSNFPGRADAIMNLLDALCNNTNARSVVQLSLNPIFRYSYNSIYDGIQNFFQPSDVENAASERHTQEQQLIQLISNYLPTPKQHSFWLFSVDVTPAPRRFAKTLKDRGYVYAPNTIASNKPVTIGHQYSALVLHPEKTQPFSPPWVVPLSVRRVSSDQTKQIVGVQQVQALMNDTTLPFHHKLLVQVNDSHYSCVTYLGQRSIYSNLVTIARVRSNRTFYRKPAASFMPAKRGHPTWYGEPFDLKDETTWGEPDEVIETTFANRRGQKYTVLIEAWYNMLMTGTREYTMAKHPFTLVRVRLVNENQESVFKRPLWLLVFGERREELSLIQVWEAYRQRYDVEHFFRFGKQRLLMSVYQTPEVVHEENWWQIAALAYCQLYLARDITTRMPYPWERYLPKYTTEEKVEASPSEVQRDWTRIIQQISTPASVPKPRGKSPGRPTGQKQEKRKKQPVIKKTTPKRKKAA
jgi:hypothetical protein